MCRSMVEIQSVAAEIRREKKRKKKDRNHRMKIYMVSLLHSATINNRWSKQLDKKAALLPHMDGTVVFARWRQCAPQLIHASLGPHKSTTGSAIFAQLTAVSSGLSGHILSPENAPSHGAVWTHI